MTPGSWLPFLTPPVLDTYASASAFLNIVLLYLTLRVSTKELGRYRHLMCAFALNDLYFTIIHSLTLPIACTFGDAFIIFASGFWSSKFSISYYAATFTQTLPMLMHLFIFRYFVIKRFLFNLSPDKVPIYTWFNTVLIIFFTVGAEATIWCGGSYILYEPDQLSREYIKPFFEMYNYPDLEYLISLYWEGGNPRIHRFAITIFFDIFLGSFLLVIVICATAIFRSLRDDMGKWSNRTRLLQRRLFNILIVQLAVPMFFVYFPCSALISLPMLHTGLNIYPNLGTCSLTIFPMLDALIVIIGVPSYRFAAIRLLKGHQYDSVTPYKMATK